MLRGARLAKRLGRAAQRPVVVIAAPPGFGKTIAVEAYLAGSPSVPLRCTLGQPVDVPAFALRLAQTLAPVAPRLLSTFAETELRLLTAPGDEAPRLVADWIAGHVPDVPCTVVIEALHRADAAAIRVLVAVVEHVSPAVRWLLVSRSDAALPVASWIGYGLMDVPVGEDDLRLTLDEALEEARTAAPSVEADDVRVLWEMVRGWPVAMAIALRVRVAVTALPAAADAARELTYRYIAEQIFAKLTGAQADFLLATAPLSSFDAQLAEALGAPPATMDALRHDVAFVIVGPDGSYRYDDLFLDFLRHAASRLDGGARLRLATRAGALLEERGNIAEALRVYGAAGAAGDVSRVLARIGIDAGEPDVMRDVLGANDECVGTGTGEQLRVSSLVARAALEAQTGNARALDAVLAEAARTFPRDRETPAPCEQALLPVLAMRAAWSGDHNSAYELLAGAAEMPAAAGPQAMRHAATALYAAAANRPDESNAALHVFDADVAQAEPSHRIVLARLLAATAELVLGRPQSANRRLNEAEPLALSPRLRPCADAIRAVSRRRLNQARDEDVAAALARMREAKMGGYASVFERLPFTGERTGYARLTATEREILELVVRGASSKEIGTRTFRSSQTVDTHVRSVCRKLKCRGRREAVALAVTSGWFTG